MGLFKNCTRHCWILITKSARYITFFLGIFCIVLAISLISAVSWVIMNSIAPILFPSAPLSRTLYLCLYVWLITNVFFNYFACLWAGPGYADPLLTVDALSLPVGSNIPLGKGDCRHCKAPKPPRAHHCPMCDKCVLKMDHHCPWINGCVGFNNQRYFCLFLLYLWLATLDVVLSIGLLRMGIVEQPYGTSSSLSEAPILFSFVLSLAIFVAMTLFVGWNGHLVMTNQTSIEVQINRQRSAEYRSSGVVYCNPYNLGLRANVQQVFGNFRYAWSILLPSVKALSSNGHSFPTTVEDLRFI